MTAMHPLVNDLHSRLLAGEKDVTLRADIRDLIVRRLDEAADPMPYRAKYKLSMAIGALTDTASRHPGGDRRARLRFALLQCQNALQPEPDRDERQVESSEIVEALTRDMLRSAALAID